jgi:hypothetical protein
VQDALEQLEHAGHDLAKDCLRHAHLGQLVGGFGSGVRISDGVAALEILGKKSREPQLFAESVDMSGGVGGLRTEPQHWFSFGYTRVGYKAVFQSA